MTVVSRMTDSTGADFVYCVWYADDTSGTVHENMAPIPVTALERDE
jgi:hypothetical protein